MKKLATVTALMFSLLFAACGGSDDGDADQKTLEDQTRADVTADIDSLAQADVEQDIDQGPVYPLPPDPVPTPDNGTYFWTDGKNKIELAYNDNMIFLMEILFSCTSETGTKAQNDFLKITCNNAFEKGYVGSFVGGIATIDGIKGKDKLYCALTSPQTIDCVYEMLSFPKVCTRHFATQTVWKSTGDCSDYAVPDCDPYTDGNCEEGMNCVFGAGDKPVCVVAGEIEAGKECSIQQNCSDGVCMELANVEGQFCYKYCKNATDCPWGTQCLEIDGHQWKICSLSPDQFETCNLLQQNCEDPNHGCYWSSSTINQPVCLPAGEAANGEACKTGSDCEKGLDCIASKSCHKICNLTKGEQPECDSIFTGCSTYYGPQNAGYCGE